MIYFPPGIISQCNVVWMESNVASLKSQREQRFIENLIGF